MLPALALLLVLAPGAAPPAAQGDGCKKCDQRGVVACSEHDEDLLAAEERVLFCSVIAACEACAGARLVDCARCDGGPDSHLIDERRAAVAAWAAEDAMGAFLGRPVPHVETEWFELVVDTGDLKQGRKKVDAHRVMHLVADDVDWVAARVAEHYAPPAEVGGGDGEGAAPTEPAGAGTAPPPVLPATDRPTPVRYFQKMRMWIWRDPADHRRVMERFLFSSSTGDFKLLGKDPCFSVWTEEAFGDVPGVRRLFTHNAAHMLLSNLYAMLWVGDQGGGWLDAGAGHWYEYARHERSVNYCIEEATVALDYHGGQWRAAIKKRLRAEEERQLPRLLPMNTGAMTLPDQALCWSFYDWLAAEHRDALPWLLLDLKTKRPARESLAERLGPELGGVLQVEEAWRAWVEALYPLRGDEPKPAPDDR